MKSGGRRKALAFCEGGLRHGPKLKLRVALRKGHIASRKNGVRPQAEGRLPSGLSTKRNKADLDCQVLALN